MNAQPDFRETSDGYSDEICRAGGHRVIVCRDGIQWIIQRITRASGGPPRASWRAVAYLTTRQGLERLWAAHTGTLPPHEILSLPPHIEKRRQAEHGEARE